MKNNIVSVIDFGSSKITCAIARLNGNQNKKFEIIGFSSKPSLGINNGMISDLEEVEEDIRYVVDEAKNQAKEKVKNLRVKEVYVGIPLIKSIKGDTGRGVIPLSKGEITDKEIEQVIMQAKAIKVKSDAEVVIHAIPQEFMVDDMKVKNPKRMNGGKRLEGSIYIVTGDRMTIQNIDKAVSEADLKVKDTVIHPIAESQFLTETEKEKGCMIIDIGERITQSITFYDGKILNMIGEEIGGSYITDDIASEFQIDREIAEEIKIKYTTLKLSETWDEKIKIKDGKEEKEIDRKILRGVVAPRVEEIFDSIRKKAKDVDYSDILGSGIILTGGTAKLDGIEDIVRRIFNVQVKVLNAKNRINGLTGIDIDTTQMASTIGLILYHCSGIEKTNKRRKSIKINNVGTIFDRFREWLRE